MFSLTLLEFPMVYTVAYLNEENDSLTAVFSSADIAQEFVDSLDDDDMEHTGVTFHTIH